MTDLTQLSDDELMGKILAQSETREIADSLGLEATEYAQRVLHYLRNPDKSPEIQLMSDEEAQDAGMPTVQDCVEFLTKAVDEELKRDQAQFDDAGDEEKSSVTLAGGDIRKKAPRSPMTRPSAGRPSAGLRGQGPKK